jgi:Ca2+/Na+ antiporter
MSFREKSAWITLIAILLVSVMFFLHGPDIFDPSPSMWTLHIAALSIAAFIVIEVVAYVVLYLRYPKDARTPKDEREQLIALKATRLAAYVYVAGSFLVILASIHVGSGPTVGYFVLMAFVIAEIVNYAARIIYYRRGS